MIQQHDSSQSTANSLQSFLANVEQETTASLRSDQQFLQEQSSEEVQKRIPHISFVHGGGKMVVPLSYVLDVGHLTAITPLPHLPAWIPGVVQLQGDILPVVDIVSLFNIATTELLDAHNMGYLLFSWRDIKVCLAVEKITEVINIDPEQKNLFPLDESEKRYFAELTPHVYGGIVAAGEKKAFLLNLQGIMQCEQINDWRKSMRQISGTGR